MNKDSSLLIPYAFIDSKPVTPSQALKHTRYFCPECGSDVFKRTSLHTVDHFYHRGYNHNCNIGPESILHLKGKLKIYQSLMGDSKPVVLGIQRKCLGCDKSHVRNHSLRKGQGIPKLEESVTNRRGDRFRADIAIYRDNTPIPFVIEILVSNQVTEKKNLKMEGIPWVEIEAKRLGNRHVMATRSENIPPLEKCPPQKKNKKPSNPLAAGNPWWNRRKRIYQRPRKIGDNANDFDKIPW